MLKDVEKLREEREEILRKIFHALIDKKSVGEHVSALGQNYFDAIGSAINPINKAAVPMLIYTLRKYEKVLLDNFPDAEEGADMLERESESIAVRMPWSDKEDAE